MRHNYVGDEGDYAKLALLKALRGKGTLGVNWYLTVHHEDNADGHKLAHLKGRGDDDWSHLDADLLREMRKSLRRWEAGDRHISHLEALLMPGAIFFGEELPTGADPAAVRMAARERWHADALEALAGADIVFVDPDNGFEVKSRGRRSKWRCKYATYEEIGDYLSRGQAVVAYQHKPRLTWAAAIDKVRRELRQHGVHTAPPGFIAFGSRGFFLMHRDREVVEQLTRRAQALKDDCDEVGWTKLKIEVVEPGQTP